jgi:hypothetical protein
MKINFLKFSAFALLVTLGVSCDQKSGTDEKIKALEEKIAALEVTNTAITPVNVQATQAADPLTLGEFIFPEMEHDFGTIAEGEVVEHLFNFTNNGQAPLIISNITASCGCTSPDWTKSPVKPGETGFVKVIFNSTSKAGVQAPTVTIQANTSPTVTRLRLKGTVNSKTAGPTAIGPVKK